MKNQRQTMLMSIMIVLTLVSVSALEITHDPATDLEIEEHRVVFTWTTDVDSNSSVSYNETGLLVNTIGTTNLVMDHSIAVVDLLAGTTYKYQLSSGIADPYEHVFSGILEVTTLVDMAEFLTLTPIISPRNNITAFLSGTTRPQARLKVYVNKDINSIPRLDVTVGSTGSFNHEITLDEAYNFDGTLGYNLIEVFSWDENGVLDTANLTVIVDRMPPPLVMNSIPSTISKDGANNFEVSGTTEQGATVTIFLDDESKGNPAVDEDGGFSHPVSLPPEGTFELKIRASDALGNFVEESFTITIDTLPPTLENLEGIDGVQHFKVVKICGDTDPDAHIKVTNMGDHYSNIETFLTAKGEGTLITALIDPIGFILGMEQETDADDNGHFCLFMNLMHGKNSEEGINNLWFEITDPVGNKLETMIPVRYKPQCGVWSIGQVLTYPLVIYSKYWQADVVPASLFVPLYYGGVGELTQVDVRVKQEPTGDPDGENIRLSVRSTNSKAKLDRREGVAFVNIDVDIPQWNGKLDDMPDKIKSSLELQLQWQVDGGAGGDTCEVYVPIAFDVDTPEHLLLHLSSQQLKDLAKVFGAAVEVIDDISTWVERATWGTLTACVLKTIWDFIDPSVQPEENGNVCGESIQATYWICDRVFCPDVPPKTLKLENRIYNKETLKGKGLENTAKWWSTQYSTEGVGPDDPTDKHYQNIYFIDSETSDQLLQEILGPHNTLNQNKVTHLSVIAQKKRNFPECKTWVIEQTTTYPDFNEPEQLSSDPTVIYRYACSKENYKTFDPVKLESFQRALPTSTYSDLCPRYDHTKCLGEDDIDPKSSIFTSVRCACLPSTYAWLENFKLLMERAQQCFQAASEGEITGGACERFLAMYVCEFAQEVINEQFVNALPTGTSTGGELNADGFRTQSIINQVKNRYQDSMFDDKLGLSSGRITEPLCFGAITGDWSFFDQGLNAFVEEMPIDSMAVLRVTSQPFGYNPLTGKIDIGYYIFVGVIPGSDVEVDLELECDHNLNGNDYCSGQIPPYAITHFIDVPRVIKRGELVDTNYIYVHKDARFWYNKATLTLTSLPIAGRSQTPDPVVKTVEIEHQGGIAWDCFYKFPAGITCSRPYDTEGYVETIWQESRISPTKETSNQFTPENTVATILAINNQFQGVFQAELTHTGSKRDENGIGIGDSQIYTMPSNQNEDFQLYNLFTFQFPEFKGSDANFRFYKVSGSWTGSHKDKEGSNMIYTRLTNGWKGRANVNIFTDAPNGFGLFANGNKDYILYFSDTCIHQTEEQAKEGSAGTCVEFSAPSSDGKNMYHAIINHITFQEYHPEEVDPPQPKLDDFDIQVIKKADNHTDTVRIIAHSLEEKGGYRAGGYNIEAALMANYGSGEPVILDYDGQEQKKAMGQISYRSFEKALIEQNPKTCDSKPVVDLIEPVLPIYPGYPSQGQGSTPAIVSRSAVPIAANIRDDCNQIAGVLVKIEGKRTNYKYSYFLKNSDPPMDGVIVNHGEDVQPDIKSFIDPPPQEIDGLTGCTREGNVGTIRPRFIPISDKYAPPVFAFTWYPPENDVAGGGFDIHDEYLITITAWDGQATPQKSVVADGGAAQRTIKFNLGTPDIDSWIAGSFTGLGNIDTPIRSCKG